MGLNNLERERLEKLSDIELVEHLLHLKYECDDLFNKREMNSNNRFKKIGLGIFALGNYQEDRKPEDKEKVRMHSYIEGI